MNSVGRGSPEAETVPRAYAIMPNGIMPYVRVFLRGFVQVALVSLNVRQVASGNYGGAFVVGGAISLVWWWNSSAQRESMRGAGAAYAFGASCGTAFGMWLGS